MGVSASNYAGAQAKCACRRAGGAVGAERERLVGGSVVEGGAEGERWWMRAAAGRINAWMATSTTRIVSG